MPDMWCFYRIRCCRHTNPPKDKWTLIVCKDVEYMGFLVNSGINPYTARKPHLLSCQVVLRKVEYGFLFRDSYLDCARLYPFGDAELVVGLELINDTTKAEIQAAVSKAKTIEKRYQDLILGN